MANVNKVILIGNLTRDPELRYTPNGTAVVEFGMAMNRKWKGRDGQQKEDTCFVDVQAWTRSAEVISEYCRKGAPLYVEGRLQLDSWEGRDGQKRSKLRVVVQNFQFLGAPRDQSVPRSTTKDESGNRSRPRPQAAPQPPSPESPPEPSSGQDAAPTEPEGQYQIDDDIPF